MKTLEEHLISYDTTHGTCSYLTWVIERFANDEMTLEEYESVLNRYKRMPQGEENETKSDRVQMLIKPTVKAKAQDRASELEISLNEYINRLIETDLKDGWVFIEEGKPNDKEKVLVYYQFIHKDERTKEEHRHWGYAVATYLEEGRVDDPLGYPDSHWIGDVEGCWCLTDNVVFAWRRIPRYEAEYEEE